MWRCVVVAVAVGVAVAVDVILVTVCVNTVTVTVTSSSSSSSSSSTDSHHGPSLRRHNVPPHEIGLERAGGKGLVEALDVGAGGAGEGAEEVGVAEGAGEDGVAEREDAGDGGGDGEGAVGGRGRHFFWGMGAGTGGREGMGDFGWGRWDGGKMGGGGMGAGTTTFDIQEERGKVRARGVRGELMDVGLVGKDDELLTLREEF